MAKWSEVEVEAPDVAALVRAAFDAYKHKTMATLRKDGSPRISGTELDFMLGEIYLGSMTGALKARDLQRDPRVAFHSATVDPEMVLGDAKIAGRAIEVTDPDEITRWSRQHGEEAGSEPPEPFHLFRVDVAEIAITRIGDPPDHLLIESWHEGRGVDRVKRK